MDLSGAPMISENKVVASFSLSAVLLFSSAAASGAHPSASVSVSVIKRIRIMVARPGEAEETGGRGGNRDTGRERKG